MKFLFYVSLFCLLLLTTACPGPLVNSKPKPDQLPPITQTGENTFGCLVNGEIWLPRIDDPKNTSNKLDPQYYQGLINLIANRSSPTKYSGILSWSYQYVYDTGVYYFKTAPAIGGPSQAGFYRDKTRDEYKTFDADSLNNYFRISKLDQANRIISGTFKLRFTKPGLDTINVTDGRFDLKYTY